MRLKGKILKEEKESERRTCKRSKTIEKEKKPWRGERIWKRRNMEEEK